MTFATLVAGSFFSIPGKAALYQVGKEFIRRSELGDGKYPVPFNPWEVELFDEASAKDSFPFLEAYREAMVATNCEPYDNFAKRGRHFMLYDLLNLAFDNLGNEGDIAECGCWKGQSTYMIAKLIQQRGEASFHVFDSFEGLSSFEDQDIDRNKTRDLTHLDSRRKHFASDEAKVRANLRNFNFISFYRGWIPDRFPEVEWASYKFVHIDVDMYQPYIDSIRFFYPRMLRGGVLVFDDYGSSGFPGARRAVDELAEEFRPTVFLRFPLGGACWIV
ncbi:TylF/MycF/NovP-related O-methyltransferase [Thalassospira sp.]|uniref:TylF/MycF/NovP-related O-methyltransferase n=1 Tax=Thalassospira sp. TaxID=1912094 RepID=UPI001B02A1EC|nr:TylF/MycF/NovP-related O-methyltransferase [Thalassospira sp.]MBO6805948.1 class I SAM-dependent methyltransferase [Thalassospira sp.]